MRVVRVDHQRHTEGFKATARKFRAMSTGRRWQAAAEHMGKVDAAFLDDVAVFDYTGTTATTRRALPGVFNELGAAVFRLQCVANAVLKVEQVGFYSLGASSHDITLNRAKRRGVRGRRQRGASITPHSGSPQLTKITLQRWMVAS
ncbi:hypothetical protein PS685_04016 [Pseudomonas fluorescens]|uniref:Uncharacterized protein n=1 Tax=Pseudomonas fluorescens TaxID=294 RepID=A0A5E6Z7R2_PSEFL|nr:hypothetical protein PS685_04016 [Pseudomonas fluorescens]